MSDEQTYLHGYSPRPAWLEIDRAAICANVESVRRWVGPDVDVMAVVKANAYGHGLVLCAAAAFAGGAAMLGVAIPEEAIALREAGIRAPILVMGASDPAAAGDLVRHGIECSLSTLELLQALVQAGERQGRAARVHVKIDTGMGRVGVLPKEAPAFFQRVIAAGSRVDWRGIMTHFATSDEEDLSLAYDQLRRFQPSVTQALSLLPGLTVHAANSAAVCRLPESYNPERWPNARPMVRAGLLIYGVPPSDFGSTPPLQPALSLKARVTQARDVPAGTTVSYGATFRTTRPSRLALVSLGYADGYGRANSNRASVLLRGRRAPVAGRVCMDQFVIDATDIGAEVGDEVVLLGRQEGEEITVKELAGWGGTVHHEVLARLGERLPRFYPGGSL